MDSGSAAVDGAMGCPGNNSTSFNQLITAVEATMALETEEDLAAAVLELLKTSFGQTWSLTEEGMQVVVDFVHKRCTEKKVTSPEPQLASRRRICCCSVSAVGLVVPTAAEREMTTLFGARVQASIKSYDELNAITLYYSMLDAVGRLGAINVKAVANCAPPSAPCWSGTQFAMAEPSENHIFHDFNNTLIEALSKLEGTPSKAEEAKEHLTVRRDTILPHSILPHSTPFYPMLTLINPISPQFNAE